MAAKSAADIVAEMVAAMKVADPEIDTSVGSVSRKILDVVGEQIAPAHAEQYLLDYVFNIEVKSEAELDDFCAMFGIYRLPAKRATGVITFSRPSPATSNLLIPANTQIGTGGTPQVIFATVANATLLKGTTSVSVPIQAVVAGESGNLPSDALTNLLTPLSGITSTTQQSDATTGGVNAESDDALKARFKGTVFRSLAGTEDMFVGLALEDSTPDDPEDVVAVHANVLGASKRWREQVQVVLDGTTLKAVSTIPASSVKHVFAGSAFFGEDIDLGQILTEGVHYTLNSTANPPEIVSLADNLVEGRIYDLDFEYVPMASRNEPDQGITNRVDVWVSGVAPQAASESVYYRTTPFDNVADSPFYAGRFVRLSESGYVAPAAGNQFLQLAWGPIIDFPELLVVNAVTYTRDVDYWVVHDDTGYGYASTSKFGLEWRAANQPPLNSLILLSDSTGYFFNRTPADVQERASRWKLVTTDLKVHAAKQVRLALNFAVMYQPAYERGVVQAALDAALADWMTNLGFRSVVQISDILAVAHSVAGVDNIRFLNSSESAGGDANMWGIQHVTADGTHLSHYASGGTPNRARDIVLAENEVATLYDVRYVTKAQNTFSEPTA